MADKNYQNYLNCTKNSGTVVVLTNPFDGKQYYGCTPSNGGATINGGVPVSLTTAGAIWTAPTTQAACVAGGNNWVLNPDTNTYVCQRVITTPMLSNITSDRGVIIAPNADGNVTVTHPATATSPAVTYGLAFMGGKTVSYPVSSTSVSSASVSPSSTVGVSRG